MNRYRELLDSGMDELSVIVTLVRERGRTLTLEDAVDIARGRREFDAF